MQQRLRDSFSYLPQLERDLLDVVVGDGIITRAALSDLFLVVHGVDRWKSHAALTNLLNAQLVEFWNRPPEALVALAQARSMRRPIYDPWTNDEPNMPFSARTAFMVFTPGYAFTKGPCSNAQSALINEIDNIKRLW